MVVGCWLSVVGRWLLCFLVAELVAVVVVVVVDCCLMVVGCWLSLVGCCLLWLLVVVVSC